MSYVIFFRRGAVAAIELCTRIYDMAFDPSDSISMFPLGRKSIGRYELLKPVASGGMATVFLGRLMGMAGFEKLVAVKVIHPHLASQKEFVEMFLDEARLSAKINHPNIIEIFEVDEERGLYFMVAEYVRGRSLGELMKVASQSGEPLEPAIYLSIVATVCDALHAAHTLEAPDGSLLHLIHRDVSPSNVLVSFDGFIKLIDFGIAYAAGRVNMTRSGVVKGKLGYMAPEQLKREPVDRRIDVYSLGVVLYTLATERHPFWGDSEGEIIAKALANDFIRPREIRPEIGPSLERAIIKALAPNPENRYQTAKEMGQELRRLMIPLGGLVDSGGIALVMEHYFEQEIIADKKMFEQVAMSPSKIDSGSGSDRNGIMIPDSSRLAENTGAADALQEPNVTKQQKNVIPATALIDHMSVKGKSHFKRHLAIAAVTLLCAATVGLAYIFYQEYHVFWQDIRIVPPSTKANSFDQREAPETDKMPSLVAEIVPVSKEQTAQSDILPDEPPPTPAEEIEEITSVEILLKGLPADSTVRVGGKNADVVEGRISVPADGKQRSMEIIAEGYRPFRMSIAPKKNGELIIRLQKKKDPLQKSAKTETHDKKAVKPMMLDCPYCDK